VVTDGNCLTSQGAGTAVEFGLALVEQLYGKEQAGRRGSGWWSMAVSTIAAKGDRYHGMRS
jgi:transcriptional regulator GlxA family with amidase domain